MRIQATTFGSTRSVSVHALHEHIVNVTLGKLVQFVLQVVLLCVGGLQLSLKVSHFMHSRVLGVEGAHHLA